MERDACLHAELVPKLTLTEAMSKQPDATPDSIADRFDLLGHLGAGGGGTVFAARDRVQGRTVAIKRLRDANPQSVYHFKREFRALADVSHPNLVTLHELFVDGRDFLLSMELVHGGSLSEYLRPGISNAPAAPSMPVAAAPYTELDWDLVRE